MKLLLVNEYHNIVTQSLIYYLSELLGPENFNWTGKKNYRLDFLPLKSIEQKSLRSEPKALTDLQSGKYDFVIFSEGTTHLFTSSHLPLIGTKRVVLDCNDSSFLPRFYWENSEIYFKAQMSKYDIYIRNSSDEPENFYKLDDEFRGNKIFPFSLVPSFKVSNFPTTGRNTGQKNYDVYFCGSAWPRSRVKMINMIKSHPEINFFGGLFNRDDLNFNCVFPDNLRFNKISTEDNIYATYSSKISINMEGNGKNCFRQFEILYLNCPLLTQKHDHYWGIKDPVDKKHCIFFEEDGSDLINKIRYYLNNEEELSEISENGHEFFNQYYHPKALSEYLISILEKFMK
jgi:hypothetical protein